ncbi:MAG: DNA repair and recombination protein RadB [Candidatus Altiarchaeales archaeon IMC4]|nr:MAG: DNA repair and recombination protein RadB [Candidatus Altiarchaeales archaeon IMC4]
MDEKTDFFLRGDFPKGTITQIYGPPASGKTNIALLAAIAASAQGKVLYIDPEGGFSTDRLKQLTENSQGKHLPEANGVSKLHGNFEDVLKNTLLIEPANFAEQRVAIDKLKELVRDTSARLVLVDSIGMLYRIEEDKNIKELGRQMAKLMHLARKYDIPVLVTNQVYTNIDNNTVTPVGGDALKYWSKVIIELGIAGRDRFAKLHRHPNMQEGRVIMFRIVQSGVEVLSDSASPQTPNHNHNLI